MPLPLLRMLTKQYRDTGAHYGDEDAISVTQLIAPVQQQRLLGRHEVYVEPLDNLWAAWGTIAHAMLEAGVSPDNTQGDQQNFQSELKLVQDFDGTKVGGTIDLLEESWIGFGNQIWDGKDYKVTSAFQVKKMLKSSLYQEAPDYYWQAQLYALLAKRAGYQVLSWSIVAICRDWNERVHGSVCGPVEVIDVPLLAEERVLNFINQRLTVWKASAMADDAGLPSCTDEERWQGRRCAKYCAAAGACHQLHPEYQLEA